MKPVGLKYIGSDKGRIVLVTLTNDSGAKIVLSNLGAGIVEVWVPDRDGILEDVTLGYADARDYFADGPCAGKVPGRYANRIARGKFSLDGVQYSLPINNGPNSLHGGPDGFQNQLWRLAAYSDRDAVFEYTSADGEMGYPGMLKATAHYEWTEDDELRLTLSAVCDKDTVVNLTNHAYWNLAGHDSGSVLDHELQLMASKFLPTDETLIPLGEMTPVAGTPMDFLSPKTLGKDIRQSFAALDYGKGYDSCWVVDNHRAGNIQFVAVLTEKSRGRMLEVYTDQPGVQVYTGNWLAGSPLNKAGRTYDDYDGVAIECQDFPDAPNHADFPSTLLHSGETYRRHINFKFKKL